jgi:hypothetical protein
MVAVVDDRTRQEACKLAARPQLLSLATPRRDFLIAVAELSLLSASATIWTPSATSVDIASCLSLGQTELQWAGTEEQRLTLSVAGMIAVAPPRLFL